ncbi:phosphate ABC transporter permease PstA [Limosilactobacillus gastricus]|uniref:phosphate ABC transporter permease PstA n=1 Tax=Limosilactobacillus gastricus TaxID=227942 RepID=UPI0026F1FA3D|nr:phosphate ABC transporter permease PstA [Limosilactobacillus gastricus]
MKKIQIDRLMTGIILFGAGLAGLLIISLIGYILVIGAKSLSWRFITTVSSSFSAGGGIRDQIFNSLYLVVLTMILALPVSLGGAIYLNEYAKGSRLAAGLRMLIDALSSLPSIVVGLFGYLVLVVQLHLGFSLLAGAVVLTIINLPILTRSIEQALINVPDLQRQAGLGLGMSRWKVITKIVLPMAIPEIVSGAILAIGRIFGEAAALIYTAGQSSINISYSDWNPFSPTSFLNPLRPAETLAVHIWKLNTEGLVPDAISVSAGAAVVLIILIVIFNLLARWLGKWLANRM